MPLAYLYMQSLYTSFMSSAMQIALYVSPPQGNSGGLELSSSNAPGYSRQNILLMPVLNMAAVNNTAVTWTATGTWTAAYYFALHLTADGTMIYWGALPRPLTGRAGTRPTIPANYLFIDWTNPATGTAAFWSGPRGYTPLGEPGAIKIVSNMSVLADLGSEMISVSSGDSTFSLMPQHHAALNFMSISAEQQMGTYVMWNVIDATRGTTAGYTVAGPIALAF